MVTPEAAGANANVHRLQCAMTFDAAARALLTDRLRDLEPADDMERAHRDHILRFVAHHDDPFDRGIPDGHLTGSAAIVSHDGDRVLLLHHRKLERWLQPGGHADPGEASGEAVALREAFEETGIAGLTMHPRAPRPLDVDVHAIPARGPEPAHDHLDLRYLTIAPRGATAFARPEESNAFRWFGWNELGQLGLDAGLHRLLRKVRLLVDEKARVASE